MRGHARVELHVVHVVEEQIAVQSGLGIRLMDERLQSAPEDIKKRLGRVAGALGYDVRAIGHIRVGTAADQILQVATDIAADVIVVGTHHRGAVERFFLGSVAEKVVRDAHCPVMVVTTKNYENLRRSRRPDPACPECLKTRAATQNAQYWCSTHARPHLTTHVFDGNDRTSNTSNPTGVRIV